MSGRKLSRKNGRVQTRWNVVYSNISNHRFKLTDGLHSCYVDPGDAEVNGTRKLVCMAIPNGQPGLQPLESQSVLNKLTNKLSL
ncbi:MAG: hypothetical protein IPO71_14680 [Nitrosomonas sp.]|nr:hypothetical protein [Nitrosomonas sp.]